MQKFTRSLLNVTIILAGLGSVGTAGATTPVAIQTAGIYDPGVIGVAGVENSGEYASAVEFGATIGSSNKVQTLYGFCVDLTHVIYVGFDTQAGHDIASAHGDAQAGFNYAYHSSTLARDSVGGASGSSGSLLTGTQIGEIGGLVNFGTGLIRNAAPGAPGVDSQHLSDELTAVQGAIWTIEYPSSTFTASGEVGSLMSQYVSAAPGWAVAGPVQTIYADSGSNQGFAVSGVPETTSWALMIAGLGLAGAALRRRRQAIAA